MLDVIEANLDLGSVIGSLLVPAVPQTHPVAPLVVVITGMGIGSAMLLLPP